MKNIKLLFCVLISLLLVIISLLLFGNKEILVYFLNQLKGDMLPAYSNKESICSNLLTELIPCFSKLSYENSDIFYDFNTQYIGHIDNNQNDTIYNNQNDAIDNNLGLDNTSEDITSQTDTELISTDFTSALIETSNLNGIVNGPIPINYSMKELADFDNLISNCYVIDSSTFVTNEELDAEKLLSYDMGIDLNTNEPKVLIYHTHGSEAFADSREGVVEDTVIGVGDELERILEETYGINVYHDRNIYDTVDGVLDRSNAYNLAGKAVDQILAENPSIEVIIDLHRDGVREDLRLVRKVDNKDTAQIMFLNGVSRLKSSGDIEYLKNPHKIENLSFSLKLFLNGRSLYGDLIRKIYIRGYCFNLDRAARATLIEVGAQTNTVEEVKNAMGPLARIIYQVLSE